MRTDIMMTEGNIKTKVETKRMKESITNKTIIERRITIIGMITILGKITTQSQRIEINLKTNIRIASKTKEKLIMATIILVNPQRTKEKTRNTFKIKRKIRNRLINR
jgi:hypothetical protein